MGKKLLFSCLILAGLTMLMGCGNGNNLRIEHAVNTPTGPAASPERIVAVTPIKAIEPTESMMQPTFEPQICFVNGDGVRIRENASIDSAVLDTLSHQTELELIGQSNGWGQVRYENTTGYIRNDLISLTLPSPKPEHHTYTDVHIIVRKSERILELWDHEDLVGSYAIALGWTPTGHKKVEGDGKTPEGEYYVCIRNPNSSFYLSLGVSYPNEADAKDALDAEVIDQETYDEIVHAIANGRKPPWDTALGGAIMIHGRGSGRDWTAGCIAVDDDIMDILWRHCEMGTPIIIYP